MSISKLARKFSLKLALAGDQNAAGLDLSSIKDTAKAELKQIISAMAKKVKESKELREAGFTLPQDPLAEFGERAKQGIENCKQILSIVLYLNNNFDDLTLEDMVKPLLSLAESIISELHTAGTDKWGIERSKFLNLMEIFGDYYTTQGGYHDRTRLNPMAKRELESKFGKLTHTFDFLAHLLRNNQKTGALDILKRLSSHGLVDSDVLDKLINARPAVGDTRRVVKNLENHEKEMVLRLFSDALNLGELGLLPTIETWNKYIAIPDEDVPVHGFTQSSEKLLSDVFRAYLSAPKADSREPSDQEVVTNNKIISRTTLAKLAEVSLRLAYTKQIKDKQDSSKYEKMMGSPEPINKIKPKKNIRELVQNLSAEERRVWSRVPKSVQDEVIAGTKDLDDVLEEFSETHNRDM